MTKARSAALRRDISRLAAEISEELEAGRRGKERVVVHPQTSAESGKGDTKECREGEAGPQGREEIARSHPGETPPRAGVSGKGTTAGQGTGRRVATF